MRDDKADDYPDSTEAITAAMIGHSEARIEYWAQSEAAAMRVADACISSALGTGRRRTGLDVGTGEGRLLPWLADHADTVIAVDPDEERLAEAKANTLAAVGTEFRFSRLLAATSDGERASVVLCSHVLQHVTRTAQDELLDSVSEVAAAKAILIVLFTHGSSDRTFTVERLVNGQNVAERVSRADFEARATGEVTDGLPIRHVDPSEIAGRLGPAGWTELARWQHHVRLADRPAEISDDIVANACASDSAVPTGRDMMIVFRRGSA